MTATPGAQPTPRALVVGEALVDVVRQLDGSIENHVGGSPANVAIGLGRLGRPVDLLTWFAPDAHGELVRRHLEDSAVHVLPGSDGAGSTSVALATLDETGAATYTFDLDWQVPAGTELAADVVVVHSSTIGAALEPGGEAVLQLLGQARSQATVTYDPNVRPALLGSAEQMRPLVARLVELADVVKVSDEDLAWLEPGVALIEVAAKWATSGPGIVVVTRGGAGVVAVTSGGVHVEVPARTVAVADTVGAGDSFMSGLIDGLWTAGLLGAERRGDLGGIDAGTLTRILERSARIAAITVSRAGANPPRLAELI
ncbi:carbohydrate kinase family protein [Pengzhenrongella frigida]|uniref:Carbohydrate kinase n=1 Tax=Pengzhenrongella frigida TaxID=1259133 RepID=A0A4Q5MXT4_9MICO|nr:carbohydrate kinase [Cellulomonas sp. HLT2-17]RYV50488.1 carbohydrate kinase [Cellulomonas sp. HLT2-17]